LHLTNKRREWQDADHHSPFGFKVKRVEVRSRIHDYAMIGDCETAALVSKTGSIDWLCWPDFSSPACFAALLGTPSNGRWRLAPTQGSRSQRCYRIHTLILDTTYSTRTGKVKVTDFKRPIRASRELSMQLKNS
jgi:GH15 family glucan-1,4-alpha-glucosidase